MRPVNQTLLTVIIGLMMLSAFVGVYASAYHYENNGKLPEVVYTTDSNTEFAVFDKTAIDSLSLTTAQRPQPLETGSYSRLSTNEWSKNNATMVYGGNNSWLGAFTGFPNDVPAHFSTYHAMYIQIPNAHTFLIDNITIISTAPTDSDIAISVNIYTNIATPTSDADANTALGTGSVSSTGRFNHTYELSTLQKLSIKRQASAEEITALTIQMADLNFDGLSSFAWEIEVIINGRYVNTWSLQDTINVVLGASIIGNSIVIVYMTDSIDFNATRKDLNGRTKSGKQKKRR